MNRRSFLATLGASATGGLFAAGGSVSAPSVRASASEDAFAWRPTAQIVGTDALAVCWRMTTPSTGTVYWTQDPGLPREQWAAAHRSLGGLVASDRCDHLVTLRGVDFSRPVRFEAVSEPVRMDAWRTRRSPAIASGIRSVGPVIREDGLCFAVLNDLHANAGLVPKLLAVPAVAAARPAFVVFNGDCAGNCASPEALRKALLEPLADLTAQGVPLLFVRGNHEFRGAMARRLNEAFAPLAQGYYGAFDLGGVRLTVLDGGEDKVDAHPEYGGLLDCEPYLAQEAEWLRSECASPDWKAAGKRLVLCHIPPFIGDKAEDDWHGPTRLRGQIEPTLMASGVDALLCAHTHHYAFLPKGFGGRPYPVMIGGGPKEGTATVMLVRADAKRLSVTAYRADGTALDTLKA